MLHSVLHQRGWQAGSEGGALDTTLAEGGVRSKRAPLHSLTLPMSDTGASGHEESGVGEMDQLSHG